MVANLSVSGVAVLGIAVGIIAFVVAYAAFISGMSGLAEMGRLAKVQRLELEEQRWAHTRRRRLEAAELEEQQQREEESKRETSTPTGEATASDKVPWWKYAPRDKRR